jgi:Ca-activated chloride channel family protein
VTFAHPLVLLALVLPAAVVAAAVLQRRRRVRHAVVFTNLEVLAAVGPARRQWRRHVPPALLGLAVLALCLGAARPSVARNVPVERATVILVVDASGSMAATDVKPTRLGAAEHALRRFVDHVPNKLRVGLVVFSTEPTVAAVPTRNRQLLRRTITSLDMFPGGGATAIGDALATAVSLGKHALESRSERDLAALHATTKPLPGHGLVSILFLSDGAQTSGLLRPYAGAERARRAGFRVYTVALGTRNGVLANVPGQPSTGTRVPPDPATLRRIAQLTGGEFTAATNARRLDDTYAHLGSSLGRRPAHTEVTFACLLAGVACVLAAGVASALWSPRLP